ncbi:hypothetical protein MMPV_000586 [Pyropia vietnamensis]
MSRFGTLRVLLVAVCAVVAVITAVSAQNSDGDRIRRERLVWQVVGEHIDALNRCDLRRLMAQHPPTVHFFLPNGHEARGRAAVEEVYKGLCDRRGRQPVAPFHIKLLSSHRLGSTLFVRWRFTSRALTRPYDGASAFGTAGRHLVREVATFDGSALPYKVRE